MEKNAFLILVPWLAIGGAENFILELAKFLESKRFSLHIIAANRSKDVAGDSAADFEAFTPFVFQLPHFLREEMWAPFIVNYIGRRNITNLFLCGCPYIYPMLPDIRRLFPNVKIYDQLFNNSAIGHVESNRQYAEYIDITFVVAEKIRSSILKQYGGNPQKVRAIYHGADLRVFDPDAVSEKQAREKFDLPSGKKIILYAGRISVEKNPNLFLDLSAEFKDNMDCLFVMAGDGPIVGEITANAEQRGLRNVFFLGFVEPCDMPLLYKLATALVITSNVEGIPLAIYEALAMNVPIITSDVGGISDIVKNRKNGYLCKKEDKYDFADSIYKVLREPPTELRTSLGMQHDWKNVFQAYMRVFEPSIAVPGSSCPSG